MCRTATALVLRDGTGLAASNQIGRSRTSNSDVAARAFISEATTKTHFRSIRTKLQLHNRVQIVVFAYENDLLRL